MKRRTFVIVLPLLITAGALWFFRGPSPERPFLLYDVEQGREQLCVRFDRERGTGHGLRTAGNGAQHRCTRKGYVPSARRRSRQRLDSRP